MSVIGARAPATVPLARLLLTTAGARVGLGVALHQAGDLAGARRVGAAAVRFRPHDPATRGLTSVEDVSEPSR